MTWTLELIDTMLVARGWTAISEWWWNVIRSAVGVRNVVVAGGRRGGKSTTVCRIAIAEVMNDKHVVPPGDIGFFAIISANKEQAKDRLKTCGKMLTALNIAHKETAEQILLEDRPVGIRCFAATLKGVVSFTCVGALCDEEARWADPDTGANPAQEVLSSLRPTMATMPNAVMWHVSSVWSTLDVHHQMMELGDTPAQRTFRGTTWEMNPTLTESDCRALEPDEASFWREYGSVPMSSDETKFFAAAFIDAASKTALPRKGAADRTAAGGDFAFRRNSSAAVTLEKRKRQIVLVRADERIPGVKPLVPSVTITELATDAIRHGADSIACDLHYIETVRETLEDFDLPLLEFPTASEAIAKAYVRARVLFSEGLIDLTLAPPLLVEQLKQTTSQPTVNGLTIKNKTVGQAHGDYVSAFVCAIWALDCELPGDKIFGGARRYGRSEGQLDDGKLTDLPPADWD